VAGGAVLDLGVYCINAARNLFEAEPTRVTADIVERDGTDDTTSAILHFPGERIAQFTVSNSVAGTSSYRLAGSDGDLRVEPAYEYTEPLVHYLTIDGETKKKSFDKVDQFAPELLHFSECILEGREPEPSGEEAWCDIRVAEAILNAARSRTAVALEPYQRRRRPTLAQVEHIRPVKKQEPVHAPSPSVK
jgi:predicted dehydrogenase